MGVKCLSSNIILFNTFIINYLMETTTLVLVLLALILIGGLFGKCLLLVTLGV